MATSGALRCGMRRRTKDKSCCPPKLARYSIIGHTFFYLVYKDIATIDISYHMDNRYGNTERCNKGAERLEEMLFLHQIDSFEEKSSIAVIWSYASIADFVAVTSARSQRLLELDWAYVVVYARVRRKHANAPVCECQIQ
jgi:hypothetical protein